MLFALRDNRHVQEAALQATERFLEIRPDALARLTQALYDESAVVAYGAARMLASICRNERLDAAKREDVLQALATAMQDRRAQRGIYRFVGSGSNEENPVQIGYFGRLDQKFYEAILEITGVVATRGSSAHGALA